MTFPNPASLKAWRSAQVNFADYDFITLFPLREPVSAGTVEERLAALEEVGLVVHFGKLNVEVSGNLSDTIYLSGHREAHEVCTIFYVAAEYGGRGDLFVFDVFDDSGAQWFCKWIVDRGG